MPRIGHLPQEWRQLCHFYLTPCICIQFMRSIHHHWMIMMMITAGTFQSTKKAKIVMIFHLYRWLLMRQVANYNKTIKILSAENQKGIKAVQQCSVENQKGINAVQRCSDWEPDRGAIHATDFAMMLNIPKTQRSACVTAWSMASGFRMISVALWFLTEIAYTKFCIISLALVCWLWSSQTCRKYENLSGHASMQCYRVSHQQCSVENQNGVNAQRCSVVTRRVLSPQTLNSHSALLVLNVTSLNSDYALLALNRWWYLFHWYSYVYQYRKSLSLHELLKIIIVFFVMIILMYFHTFAVFVKV